MNSEPLFCLVETESARESADRLFEQVRKALAPLLPTNSQMHHIGSTAAPGCLTKGDLDIVVRVPAEAFRQVDALLAARYARNEGSVRTDNFSAFEDASTEPHLGIQLTAIGGPYDFFHLFVEALSRSPALVDEYNTLKRDYDGKEMAIYRAAKDAFVERVLAGLHLDQ
jgi:GrpB-like predicted nucleotidyltransferase (UPF0157 family)